MPKVAEVGPIAEMLGNIVAGKPSQFTERAPLLAPILGDEEDQSMQ